MIFLLISGESDSKKSGEVVSEYETSEWTYAGFGSLSTNVNGFHIQCGLRYEYVLGDFENLKEPSRSVKRTTSDVFGNFSVSTYFGPTAHSLSRLRIQHQDRNLGG